MKFKRQFNVKYKRTKGEVNNSPSKTIPDQALTITELLKNHTRGLDSDVKDYKGEYFEDIEIPIFTDLTDMMEYRDNLKQQQADLEAKIEAERAEKKKKDAEHKKTLKVSQTAPKGTRTANVESVQQVPEQGTEIED